MLFVCKVLYSDRLTVDAEYHRGIIAKTATAVVPMLETASSSSQL